MTDPEFISHNKEELQPSQAEILPILQEQALFLQDVSELTNCIDTLLQPESEKHKFEFITLPLSSPFELPSALKPFKKDIDSIHVYTGDARKAQKANSIDVPAYLAVEFETPSAQYSFSSTGMSDEVEMFIHKIDTTHYRHSEPEKDFARRIETIGTISKEELNIFLMSIMMPNERGDYSAYSNRELQSSEAFQSLCELLEKQAINHTLDYEFVLNDDETTLLFSKEDGHVTSFTINYFDYNKNLPMRVEYDNQSDLNLRFFVNEESGKTSFSPTSEEINYARMLLRKELEPITPVTLESVQADQHVDILNTPEQNQQKELDAYIKEGTARLLKDLGLDSPDTSA